MKKLITLSATVLIAVSAAAPVTSTFADEVGQSNVTLVRFGGGHAGGGHVGGGHVGGGHVGGGRSGGGHFGGGHAGRSGGGHAGRSGGHIGRSGGGHFGGSKSGKTGGSVKSGKTDGSVKSGKTGDTVKIKDKQGPKVSDKTKSSGSKVADKSASTKSSGKTGDTVKIKDKQAPKLNKDEKSVFNTGGKVKDDSTLNKYAKQSDTTEANKNASRIFNDNGYGSYGYNSYRRQSIFDNPWFWMYMMNHNRSRYGNESNEYKQNMESKAYLQGYKDGYKDGEKKVDNSKKLSDSKSEKGKFSNDKEKSDYLKGYKDGNSDAKSEK